MSDAKTKPGGDVAAFLAVVEPEERRAETMALDAFFRQVPGWEPVF